MATYRRKLTDAYIRKKIQPPTQGQDDHFDTLVAGFAVRVGKTGTRSFTVLYRVGGRPPVRRLTLGRYPTKSLADAREEAKEALAKAERNIDPADERRATRKAGTFGELVSQYISRYAKRQKRTWREDERLLNKHFASWLRRPANSITRQNVIAVIEEVADRGTPYAANRCLSVVRKLFKWAVEKGLLDATPVVNVTPPARETERDRVLSDEEITTLWTAWDKQGWPFGHVFKLLLLLGQRRSEVAGMKWSDLDLKNAVWTLPAEATKSRRSHECPLPPLALEIINSVPRTGD